jgi:hypothetical protein
MAKIKELNIYLGMSIDKNGLWLKPGIGMRIELDDRDADPSRREEVIERGFELVQDALDKELDNLLGED